MIPWDLLHLLDGDMSTIYSIICDGNAMMTFQIRSKSCIEFRRMPCLGSYRPNYMSAILRLHTMVIELPLLLRIEPVI
jgi:hypothetical protein